MATLRRYTELPYVLHALRTRTITLISPKSWDDKNDAHHLEWYRKKQALKSVLALCLTEAPQTYHHWKVFTQGSSGAAIYFHKDSLLKWCKKSAGLRCGFVSYQTVEAARDSPPKISELPFLKRYAYRDEREFRLISEERESASKFRDFPFDLRMIERIVLNPWLPKKVADSVKASIREIVGCESLDLVSATIIENDEWQTIARSAEA